jgi:hypothetical protein
MSGVTPLACYKKIGEEAADIINAYVALAHIRDEVLAVTKARGAYYEATVDAAFEVYTGLVQQELEESADRRARGCTATGSPNGYRGSSSHETPVRSIGDRDHVRGAGIRRGRDGAECSKLIVGAGGTYYRERHGDTDEPYVERKGGGIAD